MEGKAQAAGQLAGVLATNLGPGRNKLLLRGLSDGAYTGRARSIVATYLDEIPVNRIRDFERGFLDSAADEWAAARAIREGRTALNELIRIATFDGRERIISASSRRERMISCGCRASHSAYVR